MKTLYTILLCAIFGFSFSIATVCNTDPCYYCMSDRTVCQVVDAADVSVYLSKNYTYVTAKSCIHLQHKRTNQVCNTRGVVNGCHLICGTPGCYRTNTTCDDQNVYIRINSNCDKIFAEVQLNDYYKTKEGSQIGLIKIEDRICEDFEFGYLYNGPCENDDDNIALESADTTTPVCCQDQNSKIRRSFNCEYDMMKANCETGNNCQKVNC